MTVRGPKTRPIYRTNGARLPYTAESLLTSDPKCLLPDTDLTTPSTFTGSENRYRHEFTGYLAGLSYLPDATEHTEVLRCLHQCAESLQVSKISKVNERSNDVG